MRHARGFTAVEAAVAFAITGSVLAVAVPAFVRDLSASRFTEPVAGLGRMSTAAVAYALASATASTPAPDGALLVVDQAAPAPRRDAFPQSAPLTPSVAPRGIRAVDPPGAWDAPGWRALGFRAVPDGVPHAFAFGFDSALAPAQSTFLAHAHGDLDGDGVTSTFEVRGHSVTGDPAGAVIEPGMYVEAEVE